MTHVFFSYSRMDRRHAWSKVELLKALGFSVWDYSKQSEDSAHPVGAILEGVAQSEVVVHLEPAATEPSTSIRWELKLAEQRGLPIVRIANRREALGDRETRSAANVAPAVPDRYERVVRDPLDRDERSARGHSRGSDAAAPSTNGQVRLRFDDDQGLLEHVAGQRIHGLGATLPEQLNEYRRGVRFRTFAVLAAAPTGVLIAHLSAMLPTERPPVDGVGWWTELANQSMLGIPAHFALVIGLLAVLLLMAITWNIANALSSQHRQLASGQMASWVVATALILGFSGVGLHFAVAEATGLQSRLVVLVLSAIPIGLFWSDGFPEALRLSIVDRPRWIFFGSG